MDAYKCKPLLDLCKSRWVERNKAYEHFYQGYEFIVQALQLIRHKKHLETYGDMYAEWDTANRSEAQQILAAMTSFGSLSVS